MSDFAPIPSRDISIIIQGPLPRGDDLKGPRDFAWRAFASIKRHYPDSEIVISTWADEETDQLEWDHLIQSEPPAPIIDRRGNVNNINRQILSTKLGLQKSMRPYALKFRADHCFHSDSFSCIRLTDCDLPKVPRLFKQPITVSNYVIRNPVKVPFLFHLSDIVQFGRTEDLTALWDTELVTPNELFLSDGHIPGIMDNFATMTLARWFPEQAIMIKFLQRSGIEVDIDSVAQLSYPLLRQWEGILAQNFHVMDWNSTGITFPERFQKDFIARRSIYKERDLDAIKAGFSSWRYDLRYVRAILNRNLFCFINLMFLSNVLKRLLYRVWPQCFYALSRRYQKPAP